MAEITLKGAQPYDLTAQQQPVSIAQNGIVAMTVPVSAAHSPDIVFQIRLLMTPGMADYISSQLWPVATTARGQGRRQLKNPM